MINTTPTGTDLMAMVDPQPWMRRGACLREDPEMFFPHEGQNIIAQLAKKVCLTCPVLNQCQEYSMTLGSSLRGIWGALGEDDRRARRRKKES